MQLVADFAVVHVAVAAGSGVQENWADLVAECWACRGRDSGAESHFQFVGVDFDFGLAVFWVLGGGACGAGSIGFCC